MTFTNRSLTVIIVYCIFFIIAAIGNLTVFITLSRGRYKKSRIALMICHLSAADLFVTFFMIPLEVCCIFCFFLFLFLKALNFYELLKILKNCFKQRLYETIFFRIRFIFSCNIIKKLFFPGWLEVYSGMAGWKFRLQNLLIFESIRPLFI